MKIASWNVNSLNVRLPHLEQWLGTFAPDVVGLQETKLEDHRFPQAQLQASGYHSVFSGQKTYNGVAILSRSPPRDVLVGVPGFEHEHRRAIAATVDFPGCGDPARAVRIVNLYVVNGQDLGTDKYALKLAWLAAVRRWLQEEARRHPRLVVLGDFNIAPDARDVHDPATWGDEHILTSVAERDALRALLDTGLHDGYRLLHADGPRSAATWVCASTSPWCPRHCVRRWWPPASTASRVAGNAPATTPRHGSSWPPDRSVGHTVAANEAGPGMPGLHPAIDGGRRTPQRAFFRVNRFTMNNSTTAPISAVSR